MKTWKATHNIKKNKAHTCVFEHMRQASCSFYFRNMLQQWWQQQHFEWRVVGGHLEKHVHLVCWNCHFACAWGFFGTSFMILKDRKNFGQESTTLCHIIIIFSTFAVFCMKHYTGSIGLAQSCMPSVTQPSSLTNLERKTNAAMSWGAANFQDLVLLICFKDDFQKLDALTPHKTIEWTGQEFQEIGFPFIQIGI